MYCPDFSYDPNSVPDPTNLCMSCMHRILKEGHFWGCDLDKSF